MISIRKVNNGRLLFYILKKEPDIMVFRQESLSLPY